MLKTSLVILLAVASLSAAAVLEDFEGAYAGAGALIADPANASNTVLKLANVAGTDDAEFLSVPLPAGAVSVTMRIYDFGANTAKDMDHYGPRWGIQGDGINTLGANHSCVNILYKTYISGYKGYTSNNHSMGAPLTSPTGTVVSPNWFIGTAGRYVKALDDIATPENEAQGAWSTWTFDLVSPDAITVTVEADDVINASGVYSSGYVTASGDILGVGTAGSVFISAGTNQAAPVGDLKFVGVLVDDISYEVPEPASLSMLVLGGLALLRRRRR